MADLRARKGISSRIIDRLRVADISLQPHVSIALRKIIERHGHVEAKGERCIVCRQEAPCPDLLDALDAVLGPEPQP